MIPRKYICFSFLPFTWWPPLEPRCEMRLRFFPAGPPPAAHHLREGPSYPLALRGQCCCGDGGSVEPPRGGGRSGGPEAAHPAPGIRECDPVTVRTRESVLAEWGARWRTRRL